jgi:hypothetical protein
MRILIAAAAVLLLAGCTYDYMNRTDRVAYSHGDAVRANLARETQNPSKGSAYSTKRLGQNGVVIDPDSTSTIAD